VLENARRRWPAVQFKVKHASMQGQNAAREVIEALGALDRDPEVDVIIVARGGGSVEDLLPFSDEGLIRAVHGMRTTVVSAIGHEPDTPLLDLVADVRASTPTDAAKMVVPDVAEEIDRITRLRDRVRGVMSGWLAQQQHQLDAIRARPSLADPRSGLEDRGREVTELCARTRRTLHHQLRHAHSDLEHQLARVRSLSPLATLERGYAVVQDDDGHVLTSTSQARPGQDLHVRVRDGRVHVSVTGTAPEPVTEISAETTQQTDTEEQRS
jgi:exodeoxyribonuclease VII large subunit